MNPIFAATMAVAVLGATPALADSMQITSSDARGSFVGPPEYFTGTAIVDRLFGDNAHMHTTGGVVTFAPGARSAWHTHPAGQMLVVTAGTGWVQEEGGEKRQIKAGDVVWTPPGVKHWHGATTESSMTHIALTNMRDGENVIWMEQVTDAQYKF